MAENMTEAEVTAQKNPGSGAITDPAQAANPPANAPTPQTDAEANLIRQVSQRQKDYRPTRECL